MSGEKDTIELLLKNIEASRSKISVLKVTIEEKENKITEEKSKIRTARVELNKLCPHEQVYYYYIHAGPDSYAEYTCTRCRCTFEHFPPKNSKIANLN